MSRLRNLRFAALAGCLALIALLLAAALFTHLMANRERVKSYIISRVNQATGGTLTYDRLAIQLFPLPHIEVHTLHLDRKDRYRLTARALFIYPRIWPMLKGTFRIRHLRLAEPNITLQMKTAPGFLPDRAPYSANRFSTKPVKEALGRFFNGLAVIEPQSAFQIESGTLILRSNGQETLHVSPLNALLEREKEDLSFRLRCSSKMAQDVRLKAMVNLATLQAQARLTGKKINVRPLIASLALPDNIRTNETEAHGSATFTLKGPEHLHGRFDLHFPLLKITRKNRHLDLNGLNLSGTAEVSPSGFSLALQRAQAEEPALDLTARAALGSKGDEVHPVFELRAAADRLDVATAGAAARSLVGDVDAINTAFAVAKQGKLSDVRFVAVHEPSNEQSRWSTMKASGHLTEGLVAIPGTGTDLEALAGRVVYEDRHVAFTQVGGHFKGVAFEKLAATIDWRDQPTLSLSTSSARVDLEIFYAWLRELEGMAKVKNDLETLTGVGRLSSLTMAGPLAQPHLWDFQLVGSPEKVRLTSSLVPFALQLNGGEIAYASDRLQANEVMVDFLDGSFTASFQSNQIASSESSTWQMDGTLGQATLDWLNTKLPIPDHLQIKPPVALSKVRIVTEASQTFSFSGSIKTAGGVDLYADFSRSPEALEIRNIRFSDGRSEAALALTRANSIVDLSFSGTIQKETADRLLRENRSLHGHVSGDFRTRIDLRAPLNTSFTGRLEGEAVRIHALLPEPISIDQFLVKGDGRQWSIGPSRMSVLNSKLDLQGVLTHDVQRIAFDVDLAADRLDEALIQALQSIGEQRSASDKAKGAQSEVLFDGDIHLTAAKVAYGGYTWTPVVADIEVENDRLAIHIEQATLCGISTPGRVAFSSEGLQLRLTPSANGASLRETVACLKYDMEAAEAFYDLSGEINLPPTTDNPVRFLQGQMTLTSENGRILYSNVLMKLLSILNFAELFAGGQTDLKEEGFGYAKATVKATLEGGKLVLDEILVDGYALKLTGHGSVGLTDAKVDIVILATPLKTVDKVIKKLPLIGYITGGALVTIPVRVKGPIQELTVVPIPPSEVGKGVLGLLERTLKSPFQLVERVSEMSSTQVRENQVSPTADPPKREP